MFFLFLFQAANCGLAFSLAVLTGVTNETEIKEYENKMKSNDLHFEQTKLVPDFYTSKLGDLHYLIDNNVEDV